ncbi:MAG: hypothetical protein RLZZ290_1158 [Pseudomonadota bacterium]
MSLDPWAPLRSTIRRIVGSKGPPIAYLEPKGDPGLFGPRSSAWLVHADFTSMMVGGIRALLLQALHPGALAGVWDHSSFRQDLQGRLARTAGFVAATTYGGREMALASIDRVNRIHAAVQGLDEHGRPYAAKDPHLLTWVHLTECWSFLTAYVRYVNPHCSQQEQDQYFAEMAVLGGLLGAPNLPTTRAGVEAALAAFRSELVFGARAQSVLRLLESFPAPMSQRPMLRVFYRSALADLPPWARQIMLLGPVSLAERGFLGLAIQGMALPIREALKDGVAAHARRRMNTSGFPQ